jgi:hypothetical protein
VRDLDITVAGSVAQLAQHRVVLEGAGMLDSVRQGAARAARRRTVVVAGGIAVLIAALALIFPLLRPWTGPGPAEPTPTRPSPSPSRTINVVLAPTELTAPVFPYTFTFVPQGLGSAYVDLWNGDPILHYGTRTVGSRDPLSIHVQDGRNAGNPPASAVMSTVTVNGAQATQWVSPGGEGGPFVDLEWPRDGRWFYASTDGTVSPAGLRRFAEGMTPGRTASQRSGTIDDVTRVEFPFGYAVHEWREDRVCARPEDAIGAPLGVCITVLSGRIRPSSPSATFTVDGNPAYSYQDQFEYVPLAVVRADGYTIEITFAGEGIEFTPDELIEIYRGVTLG